MSGGVLVVDKPSGPTSFDVVQKVRRALGAKKAGHTGTLDPLATGVLPICVDDATKVAQFIVEQTKAYDAQVTLGVETDTLDAQGKEVARAPVPNLGPAELEAALARFRGTFLQTPPMYSAVKVQGRRLYELARSGESVERAPREVTVSELVLKDYADGRLTLSVTCSKGFYVRTLAHELGRALGCGAHLSALRRTATGSFRLEQAVPLADVVANPAAARERLISVGQALAGLPALTLTPPQVERARHGGEVEVGGPERLVRALGADGELIAVADVVRGKLVYRRVFGGPRP